MRFLILAVTILLAAPMLPGQTKPQTPAEATVEVVGYKTLTEAAAYQSPVLAKEASAIDSLLVNVGNLQLEFKKGTACPVLVGGKARGLYLQGEGHFRYLAKDPVTHSMMRFNLKENTWIKPEEATRPPTLLASCFRDRPWLDRIFSGSQTQELFLFGTRLA